MIILKAYFVFIIIRVLIFLFYILEIVRDGKSKRQVSWHHKLTETKPSIYMFFSNGLAQTSLETGRVEKNSLRKSETFENNLTKHLKMVL